MTSIRHNPSARTALAAGAGGPDLTADPVAPATAEDGYLDAARATILAVGWRRSTLTDVARRAGVSRMTIYRRWPDMQALLADLMVREWGPLVLGRLTLGRRGSEPLDRAGIADTVVDGLRSVRENALFAKIVEVDPELLLPYLIQRRGRTQDLVLDVLTDTLAAARETGEVRDADPRLLASSILLTLHGFLLSAATMTGPGRPDLDALDAELGHQLERYLAP